MYRSACTIHDRDGFSLDSYGNGAAYLITHNASGAEAWLEGDDATALRAAFDKADAIADPERACRAKRDLLDSYLEAAL